MKNETITIKTGREELEKVGISDIITLKSDGNYTHLNFLQQNTKITLCKSLKKTIEEYKLDNFILIRRGLYVNSEIIYKYKGGKTPKIILKNGTELTPSRRCLKEIKENINKLK